MTNAFENKVIWITGASSGIGEALALQFSQLGAKLILSARKKASLEVVASKCKTDTFLLPLDLEDNKNFEEVTSTAYSHFGRIDMLINNGGISQRSLAADTPLAIDRKLMEVNYFGGVALSKSLLPYFQKQGSGSYVVISSLSGKFGFFLRSAYAASKFALVGFFESLRLEEEKNGISVHLVFPGLIRTNISKNALTADGNSHEQMDANQDKGITAEKCARQIISGLRKGKREIFSGGRELIALKIQRFFPRLFYKIIKKQSPT